jgi:hypothetical protein
MLQISSLLLGAQLTTSPMPLVFEIAEPGLRVWWREGDLLVAPPEGDPRPAIRPLVGLAPVILPEKMDDWNPLSTTCSPDPSAEFQLQGSDAQAHWMPPWTTPTVELRFETRVIASASLGRPLEPCTLVAANVDSIPGLELLVLWQMEGVEAPTLGLSVLRIPPVMD